jgi:hypothetical protein
MELKQFFLAQLDREALARRKAIQRVPCSPIWRIIAGS